jgi:hypothetical protein
MRLLLLPFLFCRAARVPNSPFPIAARGLNASALLHVVYTDGLSSADAFTLQALQGVANKNAPTLARVSRGAELWLNTTRDVWSVALDFSVGTLPALISLFKSGLTGYVLCSLLDNSTNAALAAAAALNVLVVTPENVALATAAQLPLLYDVRGRNAAWAIDTFNGTAGFAFSRSVTTLQLPSESECCMADYSVAMGVLQWWPDGDNVTNPVGQRVWGSMSPPFAALGWGPDELGTVATVSAYGGGVAASNWASNLDVYSNFDLPLLSPPPAPPAPAAAAAPVHTVCFLMSDGDNVQFLLDGFATDARWWGSPARGSVPMGWTLSAPTADLCPVVPAYLYATARADGFVAGVSGAGYMYPDEVLASQRAGAAALDALTALSAGFMAKAGLRVVNVLARGNDVPAQAAESYLRHEGVDAVIWYPYSDYSGLRGSITWANGKPVIGGRFNLWGDGTNPKGPTFFNVTGLADALLRMPRDPAQPEGYSLVPLHAWSHTVADAAQVMALVEAAAPGVVQAVTPAEFVARIVANVHRG